MMTEKVKGRIIISQNDNEVFGGAFFVRVHKEDVIQKELPKRIDWDSKKIEDINTEYDSFWKKYAINRFDMPKS